MGKKGGAAQASESCTVFFPVRREAGRLRVHYHAQTGTKGEALGFVTAPHALFLVTPSMLPPGTSLILEAAEEEGRLTERETMTGKVIAACPSADEFGFPPGIGVRVTDGMIACLAKAEAD